MARPFHGFSQFPLVFGTNAGFFSRPNLSQTGKKTLQKHYILKVNFLGVSFAKITLHNSIGIKNLKKECPLRLFLLHSLLR